MPSKRNVENFEKLKKELDRCSGFLVLDCSGIDVKEITLLRRKLEETDARLRIYKNRLIKIAINETKKGLGTEEFFKGPSALVFFDDEPIRTIKFLFEYTKDKEKPKFKGCFVFDRVCGSTELPWLAKLRPLNEERAIFISLLQRPIVDLASTLQSIPQNFLMTIEAIKDKKQREQKEA